MSTTTNTLRWNDAVEQAFDPTDLDHAWNEHRWYGEPRIGDDGKICDHKLIRTRAASAYAKAHRGEHAYVVFFDPKTADDPGRPNFSVNGALDPNMVVFPSFDGRTCKSEAAFMVGNHIVPFAGVSSIQADGDSVTVTL